MTILGWLLDESMRSIFCGAAELYVTALQLLRRARGIVQYPEPWLHRQMVMVVPSDGQRLPHSVSQS
jgi:hypothetical protein